MSSQVEMPTFLVTLPSFAPRNQVTQRLSFVSYGRKCQPVLSNPLHPPEPPDPPDPPDLTSTLQSPPSSSVNTSPPQSPPPFCALPSSISDQISSSIPNRFWSRLSPELVLVRRSLTDSWEAADASLSKSPTPHGSQDLEHQLELYLSNSAIRAFLASAQGIFVDVSVLVWMLAVLKPTSLQDTTFRSLEDWILDVDTLVVECFVATVLIKHSSSDAFMFISITSNISRVPVNSHKIFKPYGSTGDSTFLPWSSGDGSFTGASCQFTSRCLASVYRVHLALSRDVVLEFVYLFFQLSQASRVYTASSPLLMNIIVKFRHTRSFLTVKERRSVPSSAQTNIRHAQRIQQDTNLIIWDTDAAWGKRHEDSRLWMEIPSSRPRRSDPWILGSNVHGISPNRRGYRDAINPLQGANLRVPKT